jgi:hypothetical protein
MESKIKSILAIANHIQLIDEELSELEEIDFKPINAYLKQKKTRIEYLPFYYKVKGLIKESKGFIELQNEMYKTDEMEAMHLNALYQAFTTICNSGLEKIVINGTEYNAGDIRFSVNEFSVLKIDKI